MMFIQYVIWGAWYVTITTYLTQTLHFTGTQAGLIFSTVSLASLVSPFFVGLVADRFFATERVMAFLYIVSAALLFMVTRVTTFSGVFWVMLIFCLPLSDCRAVPTRHDQSVKDPGGIPAIASSAVGFTRGQSSAEQARGQSGSPGGPPPLWFWRATA